MHLSSPRIVRGARILLSTRAGTDFTWLRSKTDTADPRARSKHMCTRPMLGYVVLLSFLLTIFRNEKIVPGLRKSRESAQYILGFRKEISQSPQAEKHSTDSRVKCVWQSYSKRHTTGLPTKVVVQTKGPRHGKSELLSTPPRSRLQHPRVPSLGCDVFFLEHLHHLVHRSAAMASMFNRNRFGAHGDVMSASPSDEAGKASLLEEIKSRARCARERGGCWELQRYINCAESGQVAALDWRAFS